MYITSYDALQRVLEERANRRDEVRAGINGFVRSSYGVEGMTDILPQFLNIMEQGRPVAFLARQIASMCVEDISFEAGAEHLGLQPVIGTFVRDSFATRNHDKLHRVKIPWISWSKRGNMVLEHKRVHEGSVDALEGLPLERIACSDGRMLPQFHQDLRTVVGLTAVVNDVSPLHSFMLSQACHRPSFVLREVDGRERHQKLERDNVIEPRDRPPASWYYPYYLSWFIDGRIVLFETYDNPIGQVSHAKLLFEEAMREVTAGTGFAPIVVKIPPLSMDMLYCNRHFLENPKGVHALKEKERGDTGDTVAFFRSIAESVIAFR